MSIVAQFIAARINELGKQQWAIAEEAGFDKPNIITMIKQGKTKLPLNKVGPMAKALECDPAQLLKLCLMEYLPDTWQAIDPYLGNFLPREEADFIEAIRARSPSPMQPHLNENQRQKLGEFLATLGPLSQP